eukprot:6186509-Lingulodinium_polyedra.AAC.1
MPLQDGKREGEEVVHCLFTKTFWAIRLSNLTASSSQGSISKLGRTCAHGMAQFQVFQTLDDWK